MNIVLDTSVIISMLGSGSASYTYDIMMYAKQELVFFIANEETLAEIEDVASRKKFIKWIAQKNPEWQEIWQMLQSLIQVKKENNQTINLNHPNYKKLENRDEKDLKFLYICQHQKVDILITQDKDLLDLGTHNQTKIMKPNDALLLIQETLSKTDDVK